MTDDAAFERELRAMLTSRDPGATPARLSLAIAERLDADRAPGRLRLVGRWVAAAGAVAVALVAIVALAVLVGRPAGTGPGGTVPSAPAPYEVKPGDGVAAEPPLPLVQGTAGLVAFGSLLALAATTVDRRTRVAAALGSLAIAWVALNVGTSDALGFVAGVSGLEDGRIGPAVDGEPTALFVDATGDLPFTMYLTVTNTSGLPLELEGLAAPRRLGPGMVIPMRFVGVAVLPDTSVELASAPRVPFAPLTLAPGGSVDLAVLGMAGQCAISPPDLAGAGRTWLDRVEIVYEQLTIYHTASVELPDPIYVAETDPCLNHSTSDRIAPDRPLVLGEEPADHGQLERPQDAAGRLAIEEEGHRPLDEVGWIAVRRSQASEITGRDADLVLGDDPTA